MKNSSFFLLPILIILCCCNRIEKGENLSAKEIENIEKFGLLDSNSEQIILFHSQAGGFNKIKKAGNFFTNKRLASYWIDDHDSDKNSFHTALYQEVDTIILYDYHRTLFTGSFLEIRKKNAEIFRVYVNADSTELWIFFNRAIEEWERNKQK